MGIGIRTNLYIRLHLFLELCNALVSSNRSEFTLCSSRQLLSVIIYFRRDLQIETVFQAHFRFVWSQLFFVAASEVFPAECVQESMEGGSCPIMDNKFLGFNAYKVKLIFCNNRDLYQHFSSCTNKEHHN